LRVLCSFGGLFDFFVFFFFFQAEDGIRDRNVTGVQTCALPICFLSLSASFLVSMNKFSVSKAFALLSLVTCKFFFFLPLSVTLISFIISLWIVVRTFSVFNSIAPL